MQSKSILVGYCLLVAICEGWRFGTPHHSGNTATYIGKSNGFNTATYMGTSDELLSMTPLHISVVFGK